MEQQCDLSIPSLPIRHNLKKKNFYSSIWPPGPLKDCARRATSRPYRHFARPCQRHVTLHLPNADTSYDFLDKTPKGCLSAESVAIWGQKLRKSQQPLALGELVTAFRMR